MSTSPDIIRSARRGIIDLHSHWLSPRITERLLTRSQVPRFAREARGVVAYSTLAAASDGLVLGSQWFDIDIRLAHLDDHGIAHQLISWPTTLGFDPALEPRDSLPLWSDYNDDLAVLVGRHPDRLSGVAVLSTADIDWSVRELSRAHDKLGLLGAVLPVNVFASLESARRFEPVFAAAQKYRSHIYLHTGFGHPSVPGQPPVIQHGDSAAIRWITDSAWHFSSAAVTLAFTDFLRPYPDVTVQVAMLGGSGLIALVAEQLQSSVLRNRIEDPRPHFRQLWFDTGALGGGTEAVTASVRILGADRIVFGTDYAPHPSVVPVIDRIEAASLTAQDKQRIFSLNGLELLARHKRSISLRLAGSDIAA